jgi:hypothetical protein
LISIEELEQRLNPHAAPSFASVATVGDGVYEALEAITRAVLEDFESRMPEHRDMMTGQLMVPEGGLADALRDANLDDSLPKPKQVLKLDFSAEMPSPLALDTSQTADFGEEAARLIAESGTRPVVGTSELGNESFSPSLSATVADGDPKAQYGTVPSRNEIKVFTMSRLWPLSDREIVRSAESALARRDWATAVTDCGTLVERTFAAVAQLCGEPGLTQSSAMYCLMLGVDGRKFLEFQRVLSSVKESCIPSEHEAFHVYAFSLLVRQAQVTLTSE